MQAQVTEDGVFRLGGIVARAALGRAGLRAADAKQEGDGATPAAVLPLRRVLFRADRLAAPACAVPVEPIAPADGWCDDPAHPDYNRMVRLPHPASCEALWRDDAVYDLIGVLGWNDAPVRRGRGSAIFLHVVAPDFAPTAGCVALALADLRRVLAAGLTGVAVRG